MTSYSGGSAEGFFLKEGIDDLLASNCCDVVALQYRSNRIRILRRSDPKKCKCFILIGHHDTSIYCILLESKKFVDLGTKGFVGL